MWNLWNSGGDKLSATSLEGPVLPQSVPLRTDGRETQANKAMGAFAGAVAGPVGQRARRDAVASIAPTRRSVIVRDGSARLLRFHGEPGIVGGAPNANANEGRNGRRPPVSAVLLMPSMINRWYVLDLCTGSSMVAALVAAGLDVYAVDWGAPRDEDRHLSWSEAIDRAVRFARIVARRSPTRRVSLLGYCMGATVAAIAATQLRERLNSFVNLAGPIDFSHAGVLGKLVDPAFFDPLAIASAGNVTADQMQAGFVALDPLSVSRRWTTAATKIQQTRASGGSSQRGQAAQSLDPGFTRWVALDYWAADNVGFPAAAWATYIQALYQRNELANAAHFYRGSVVDLRAVTCPVLTITAQRDSICPPAAATALSGLVGSDDVREVETPGGHVGAVVGRRAAERLYPELAEFFLTKRPASAAKPTTLKASKK